MPIRTSVVTGKKYEQSELLRFTMQKGKIVFDKGKKAPGRGGYVENDSKLVEVVKSGKLDGKIRYFLRVN
ncbi:MAG: DUF448 domain-containing protein [Candidatus Peregrinibacteria bacterium]|nr:DUF448 domain-containing protein [Candidatus Peregrinibacteria bacterium]